MFAFALWDADAQRLVLARDPFGKKPLFIAMRPGVLVFGSEIEPLLQFPGVDRTFDLESLDNISSIAMFQVPQPYFAGS